MSDQVMTSDCEHAYVTRVRGGEPVSVRACSLCGQPDWPDLRKQVEQFVERLGDLSVEHRWIAVDALEALAGDAREPERYRLDFQEAADAFREKLGDEPRKGGWST